MVNGHGPECSPLMLVSDYCERKECETGKVLTEASGRLCDSILRENRYSLDKCYKTAYFKCDLPGYASKNRKKSQEALDTARTLADWDKILVHEIINIEPNVILSFGEQSLRFLTGETGIKRFRGSILPLAPSVRSKIGLDKHIKVIPTYHPREIFINPTYRVYVSLDYARAIKYKDRIGQFEEPGNLWIARTVEQLENYWKRARYGEFLVTDIETRHNLPICASLCADGEEAVTFLLNDKRGNQAEIARLWLLYAEILRSPMPKVNQNIVYDWTVLRNCGLDINNIVGDTMLMAHAIYPELPKGLDFLNSIYTEIPYYKDEGREYDSKVHDIERYLYYNAKDSLSTWRIWKAQQTDAEDLNVKNFYFNFVHPLIPHYKKINDRGIKIDQNARFELLEKYNEMLTENSKDIALFYGKPLNVRSSKQVGIFVYEYLNCPLHTHVPKGGNETYNTDEDTLTNIWLNEIYDVEVKKILEKIIIGRKIANVINMLETPFHHDWRMRTSYNLAGTKTGRTSTSQTSTYALAVDGKKLEKISLGTAFHKIPKHPHEFEFVGLKFGDDIRRIFVPSEGYELFSLDGKNAEGRVVCVLAEDWTTLDYIERGEDLHKLTASWLYNDKPLAKISYEERQMGKKARHAGNLGQSGAGLSTQIYKPIKICNQIMDKFHKMAPNVKNVFHYGIERLIDKEAMLINPFGRRRDFYGISKQNKHDVYKEAYSYIPQGTVSDHFKAVSLEISKAMPLAFQLGEFHDGLLYEIPLGTREEFKNIVLEATSRKIDFRGCSMPRGIQLQIPVDMEVSEKSWFEMEKLSIESKELELIA
jgi:uracil-DNA glycosylase family 4